MKVILFDFWGTLVQNGVWSPIKQVKNILQIDLPFSDYVVRMERAMMTKPFASLREAFEAVCEEFEINAPEDVMEELIGMWNKSWMLAKPFYETVEVLQALKEKYTVVLVSNTDCISVKRVLEKFELEQHFHQMFLSCEVGMIKTDEAFLEHVLKEIGVEKEDCLLVGDSLQSDVKAAENAGIKAMLVDRRGTREYSQKIKSLWELLTL